MMRNAVLSDHAFIYSLVLQEASKGHFSPTLLQPAAMNGWNVELGMLLTRRQRVNGLAAFALIWQIKGIPAGFVIMSAGYEGFGNELWMAAIAPEYRGQGEGKKMILEIVNFFKGKNKMLGARCAPESRAMYHILTSNNFAPIGMEKSGYRALMYQG